MRSAPPPHAAVAAPWRSVKTRAPPRASPLAPSPPAHRAPGRAPGREDGYVAGDASALPSAPRRPAPRPAPMSWVALALVAALGGAAVSLTMKRAVGHGGPVLSAAAIRLAGGALLATLVATTGRWPGTSTAYWRTVALIMPPEALGLVCMARALRAGDLSEVQPLFGILPLFVLASGALVLHEVPTAAAAAGILVLAMGVYTVGLRPGASALEPLRALARSRGSWYAVGACACWSITTVLHKYGIAAVGPLAWATTLAVGSGLVLAASLPLVAWRHGGTGAPRRRTAWATIVLLAGAAFALQQVGLQLALQIGRAHV